MRADSRTPSDLRDISFVPNIAPHASGSVLVSFGKTKVICAVNIEEKVPGWMKYQKVSGGWLTAEYSMLPYSTLDRKPRSSSRGQIDGRSSEIQRLIGRSLRAVVDLQALGPRTIWVDCDVLQADGGTRTASVTGACVAIAIACNRLMGEGKFKSFPLKQLVSAVSAGVVDGEPLLDLCYTEDRDATVDFNAVLTEDSNFVELQGSGEESTFTPEEMAAMLALCKEGCKTLNGLQREAILAADQAGPADLQDLASAFS